jgi:hypothetical protein
MEIDLIYCGDGNKRFAQIAIDHGFRYGSRLPPRGLHFPVWFADQDWKKPDQELYISELAKHQPHMASVLDWEQEDQLDEVLAWAEDAARFVNVVVIIPKVCGGIARLPRVIGGKPVRLGYSVPTRYGGTSVPIWEFFGWPGGIHLLGGSPQKQMELKMYFNGIVRSATNSGRPEMLDMQKTAGGPRFARPTAGSCGATAAKKPMRPTRLFGGVAKIL